MTPRKHPAPEAKWPGGYTTPQAITLIIVLLGFLGTGFGFYYHTGDRLDRTDEKFSAIQNDIKSLTESIVKKIDTESQAREKIRSDFDASQKAMIDALGQLNVKAATQETQTKAMNDLMIRFTDQMMQGVYKKR